MWQLLLSDADRALAAELGLLLVQQPVTDTDRIEAAHPQAVRFPESWLVRSVLTRWPLGRLRFTAVDCLYVSKFDAGLSGIEESVAEALYWITPLQRHARTGEYSGTEVIVRRFGSMFERPRALTECGAKASAADYSPIRARSALVNGGEICPLCRSKLEARCRSWKECP